jgi:hypothetical protein
MTDQEVQLFLADLAIIILFAQLLLPVFFVVSGLSVNLSSVGLSGLVELCLILRPCGRGGRAGPPLS